MSDFDYGPLRTYEITWRSGHVERVQGHQAILSGGPALFGGRDKPTRFTIHGEINGRWLLVISALEEDVRIVRDVTEGEWVV